MEEIHCCHVFTASFSTFQKPQVLPTHNESIHFIPQASISPKSNCLNSIKSSAWAEPWLMYNVWNTMEFISLSSQACSAFFYCCWKHLNLNLQIDFQQVVRSACKKLDKKWKYMDIHLKQNEKWSNSPGFSGLCLFYIGNTTHLTPTLLKMIWGPFVWSFIFPNLLLAWSLSYNKLRIRRGSPKTQRFPHKEQCWFISGLQGGPQS